MFQLHDIVIYVGDRYEITSFSTAIDGGALLHLKLVNGWRKITVASQEVKLVHRGKGSSMQYCECGQWQVLGFTEPRWHSHWCPLFAPSR